MVSGRHTKLSALKVNGAWRGFHWRSKSCTSLSRFGPSQERTTHNTLSHEDNEEDEAEPEPKEQPEAETKDEPEPKDEPKPEAETMEEAEPMDEPEPETMEEAEPMDEPEPEPKEEPMAEPEPEAEAEAEPEPDPEAGRSFICRVWALLRVAARNVLVSVSMRDLPLRALSVWASVCMS